MTDPRFFPDLNRISAQIPTEEFGELEQVKGLLSKLDTCASSNRLSLEGPLQQLDAARQHLGNLTDQMHDLHQAFQAMQSWQSHITTSFSDLSGGNLPED